MYIDRQMMNALYQVLQSTSQADGGHEFLLRLDANCDIYRAHFPGRPVTPGACIVEIAHRLAETLAGRRLRVTELKNVKFLAVIDPREIEELTYAVTPHAVMPHAYHVTVTAGDKPLARLTLLCRLQN